MTPFRSIFLTLVILVLPGWCQAQKPTKKLTERDFCSAYQKLMKDPIGDAGLKAAQDIYQHILQNDDIEVSVGNADTAWALKKPQPPYARQLLAAYMAGSAKAQMVTDVKRHDPYMGLMEMFRMYQRLKKKDTMLRIPELDALLKVYRTGKLSEFVIKMNSKKPAASAS